MKDQKLQKQSLRRLTVMAGMSLGAVLVSPPLTHAGPPTDTTSEGRYEVVQASELPAVSRALLNEAGVRGDELTIEQRGDLAMVDDGEAWTVVQLPPEGSVSPLDFSAGICEGRFFNTTKVGSNLEWGARNYCVTNNPNDVYPHRISSQIRIGRYGGIIMEARYTASSAAHHEFNTTVTANGLRACKSTVTYRYDTVVYVTVGGTQFGPKVSNSVSLACDIG